jgi:hypothetical protein
MMSEASEYREYQEVVAALLLPGPFDANGKSGWNVRELTAVCPAVSEPHRASQILYDLARQGVACHVGGGTATRHYLRDLPHGGYAQQGGCASQDDDLRDRLGKRYPGREILAEIAQNREGALVELRNLPKGGAHIRQWIWDAWIACPGTPLTKKEILAVVRKSHANCPEHPVSQQLHEMTRAGKLRQHEEPGKPVAFVPVREPDLFTIMPDSSPKASSAARLHESPPATGRAPIAGILPEVSVYLGDEDASTVNHHREVRAFVAMDADGNIQSIRIDPGAVDISSCA